MDMTRILAKLERNEKMIFFLSFGLLFFWLLGHTIDTHRYKVVGAIFEMLWVPMILMLFILPVISLSMLIKKNINFRAYWIYALLLNAVTLFVLCKLP